MLGRGDDNSGLWDFEMLGKKFNQCGVGFAVVGLGTKIDGKLAWASLDNLFLRTAWLDGDLVFHGDNYSGFGIDGQGV